MKYILSMHNISEYLINHGLKDNENDIRKTKNIQGKNFNLLLDFENEESWFIKQEFRNSKGEMYEEFKNELHIHDLVQSFTDLGSIKSLFPEVLHFDADNSIMILKYLKNYKDLADFYIEENIFPVNIAASLGKNLGELHRKTSKKEYKDFLLQNRKQNSKSMFFNAIQNLEKISPEIFGMVTEESLQFFSLYQRCDDLQESIAELLRAFQPCCLIHGDLKLNNILLHIGWEKGFSFSKLSERNLVKLIDWERAMWGDPAFDLGTIIASYLQIWLKSMVVSKNINIKTSINLATTPLTLIQSSNATLINTYIRNFPKILEHYPNLISRIIQYAGLSLVIQIVAMIEQKLNFGNKEICSLQVAKSLLCYPDKSISTIFGTTEFNLVNCH